ncbi:hypothetical protein H696_03944 [Fonticula alba]|uniref:ATP-binding cassette, subfamily B (MDR/TAP), member 1 n=1 Tax=Fonticula alba TaxID=691883 RepID=A0A058Z6J3_FONAL|nr:hypothetical protein H696_03944 [Fonticula alba]KCV69523.1 hypothetical protein H696_03944 [Fonticula alba]|eukprot:XP_009496088.1 hypothetical protein H696_03944 [Fonticula alba]
MTTSDSEHSSGIEMSNRADAAPGAPAGGNSPPSTDGSFSDTSANSLPDGGAGSPGGGHSGKEPLPLEEEIEEPYNMEVLEDEPIEEEDKSANGPKVGLLTLFRYATKTDVAMILFGFLCAAGHGVLQPLFSVIMGSIINSFGGPVDLVKEVSKSAVWFVIFAGIAFVTSYFQVATTMYTSHMQANRIREHYFQSMMRQEMGWFDTQKQGSVTSRISSDVFLIQDAISDKLASIVQNVVMFIAGFAVAFAYSWKMTLVIMSLTPLIMVCGGIMGKVIQSFALEGQKAYSIAGSVAEEVFGAMRTVAAFGGEHREIGRYSRALIPALRSGEKKGQASGLGIGSVFLVIYCAYGLAFWYGSTRINAGELDAGKVIVVFFSVMMGSMSIGTAAPNFATLAQGLGAAYDIFNVIDRVPEIDNLSDEGLKPEGVVGNIEFRDIHFTYPSRPDTKILNGLNLSVKAGTTVALVGHSGCGKSTTIALLERFYDPASGTVTLDGNNLKDLSIRWLRSNVALVSQEPVLFSTTIYENIRYGKLDATQEEIEAACRMANAHDFISKLPLKYETMVGERGGQLSGGQKQRIAIARALISNPKILLLDEATSALDNRSERVVQDALDKASKGRTTIVIAHRLSTVRNADMIVAFDKGPVLQKGTHDELMAEGGLYKSLVERQMMAEEAARLIKAKQAQVAGKDAAAVQEEENTLYEDDIPDVLPTKAIDVEDEHMVPAQKMGFFESIIKHPIARAFSYCKDDWPYVMLAAAGAFFSGIIFSAYSFISTELINAMIFFTGDKLMEAARTWALVFLGLGIYALLSNYLLNVGQFVSAERLTDRIRKLAFKTIVRQNIGWFDLPANATGALATRLSSDATYVQGGTTTRLAMMLQIAATLISGVLIAMISCWRIGLVVTACMPLSISGGFFRIKAVVGFNERTKKAYEKSGFYAVECISNIRTVVSLNRQETFSTNFSDSLEGPRSSCAKSSNLSGVAFGFAECIGFLIFALAFWYGSVTVDQGHCDFAQMNRAIIAVVFGSMTVGQLASFAPDYAEAKRSLRSIFELLDRQTPIDALSDSGNKISRVEGRIEFRDIRFHYPNREDNPILRGISFTAEPGQTVALVGPSGCGKSTLIQLLERFYDPVGGQILIDGMDTRDMNIASLRQNIGLVQQEPILFSGTIRENVRYGKPDCTDEEILQATRFSNAHSFIQGLSRKYETRVGDRGAQLSGGQKQRVAIARAIVRTPPILLLDEATSALDSESEAIVQDALDKAAKGRTTIVIAHRLSTIRNADKIVVIENGQVLESGTHDELMDNHGLYALLVSQQAGL